METCAPPKKVITSFLVSLGVLTICCCGLATDVGDEESVFMTAVVHQPIGGDSYSCVLSDPDTDASINYARYRKTRTNNYSYNYYNREPTGSARITGRPGSIQVHLSANYDNYFGIFYCRGRKPGRLLTTVTATVLLSNAKIVPTDGLYTKTVNVGDVGVALEMTGIIWSKNDFAWRFNDSDILQSGASSTTYSIGRAVTANDAGVYECHYLGERGEARQGLVRLIVRGCPAGRWGAPDCTGICDVCYNGGICNDRNGRCQCPAGFSGKNCLTACGPNKFGFSCEIDCSTRSYSCTGQVFCLPDPLGCTCAAGFKGRSCQTVCEAGKYGGSCLQDCHCRQPGNCDRFTGECTGANNGCEAGWSGTNCQFPDVCNDGYYGADCTQKCQCEDNRPCNKMTGECSNGQCKLGYAVYTGGSHCEECRGGTYGLNCVGICNCVEQTCSKITGFCNRGCKGNWALPYCTTGVLSLLNTKANAGQASTFTCIVTGTNLPSVASVSLFDGSVSYTAKTHSVTGSNRIVTFEVPEVFPDEEFTCRITGTTASLTHPAKMFALPVLSRPPRATDVQAHQVTVEWDEWNSDEGDEGDPPVTAYTVYYRLRTWGDVNPSRWQSLTDQDSQSGLSATVTGLQQETIYEIRVSATREGPGGEGRGGPRLRVTTLCSVPLMSPSNVQASSQLRVPREISISWQGIGVDDYGCTTGIIRYRVRYKSTVPSAATGYTYRDTPDAAARNATLTGLEPFTKYSISIGAENEIGVGPWSEDVTVHSPEEAPPPPKKVTVPRSDTSSITVVTDAATPLNLNGNVSHYVIRYRRATEEGSEGDGASIRYVNETGFQMSYMITGLPSMTEYIIEVKIVNGAGESEWSQGIRAKTIVTGNREGQSSPAGGIVGGLFAVLLILTIAAVLLFLIRRRRQKNDYQACKETAVESLHTNKAYDNTIYENTVQGGTCHDVGVSDETQADLDDEKNIYANAGLEPKPGTPVQTKSHIPPKPNRKPPPPVSSITLQREAVEDEEPLTAVTRLDDTDGDSLKQETMEQSSDEDQTRASSGQPTADQCVYGNLNLGPTLSVPIPADKLEDYMKGKKASTTDNLKYEFSLLPGDQTRPWTVASDPDLKSRNRFKNIIPYDHSRVPLVPIAGLPQSHYYNASYIQDYEKKNSFIAAMGPNTASLNDFWRMVWQEKIDTIVMLTQLIENNKDKCKQYWPSEPESEEQFGNFVVKLLNEEPFSDYTVRKMEVHQVGEEDICRTITHFKLYSWPDMGVLLYPTSVLHLAEVVKAARSQARKNSQADVPLLVHCSAGVGRTGTFIAIYTLLDKLKTHKEVSVFGFVNQMRENRVNMVQTCDQYVFIYSALLEGYLSGDTRIELRYFADRFAKLQKLNPKTRKRCIEEQYTVLNRVTPMPKKSAFGASLLPENADKNRFPDVLPVERNRPSLVSAGGTQGSGYINAAFVDSFKQKDAFITTQMPLPNTVPDIWRLAYDWQCPSIVMMNDSYSADNDLGEYMPEIGVAEFGTMTVEVLGRSKGRVYTSTTLKVSRTGRKDKSLMVKHFQLHGWAVNENKPTSPMSILELMNAVQRWTDECQSTNPTIVHCINGVGRSGVFCTVSTVLEEVGRDGVINVFQAVKRLRMSRPQMIESLDQYVLCYEVVSHHLERFKQYDNLI